ncbi:MAG: hypothetical protein WBS19_14740 [Candidatus Korobacteraceae bacterium]
MSKKWHPSAAKVMGGVSVVWECSVCGSRLTQADMKSPAKQQPGSVDSIEDIEASDTE